MHLLTYDLLTCPITWVEWDKVSFGAQMKSFMVDINPPVDVVGHDTLSLSLSLAPATRDAFARHQYARRHRDVTH